jgi:Anti-sigma factor NepR
VLPGILGKQLKAAYSELLNAPVPDAITQLIKELERKEPRPRKADDEPEEGGR